MTSDRSMLGKKVALNPESGCRIRWAIADVGKYITDRPIDFDDGSGVR